MGMGYCRIPRGIESDEYYVHVLLLRLILASGLFSLPLAFYILPPLASAEY